MMTNLTSDEREEQLLQAIVETPAGERIRMKCGAADLRSVITDLISMIPYAVNEVDAGRLADYHKIGSMPAIVKSVEYGAESLAQCVEMAVDRWYHRGRAEGAKSAATSMRSLCMEKVKAMGQVWKGIGDQSSGYDEKYFYGKADAADDIETELESLTLDQVEQKQK